MQTTTTKSPIAALDKLIGRETALDWVHGDVRNALSSVKPVVEYGMCLVTCSDEYQGELRASFDRDVAQSLMASLTLQQRRIFSVANMGGRVEPGALQLASDHFTVKSAKSGAKLLFVEIASHVGKLTVEHDATFGVLDRFGVCSSCCGALTLLLEKPKGADAVRHPWFDQLSAFFGPQRLAILREDKSAFRMVKTAVIHAVLQAESAIVDLMRHPPSTPTHVVMVPAVVINQRGPDSACVVGWHHLFIENGEMTILGGASLRSTPDAIEVALDGGRLRMSNSSLYAIAETQRRSSLPPPRVADRLRELERASSELRRSLASPTVRDEIARIRARMGPLRSDAAIQLVYERPFLRGLVQRCAVLEPELGLAALALTADAESPRAKQICEVLSAPPGRYDARRALHDLEAELQETAAHTSMCVLECLLDSIAS